MAPLLWLRLLLCGSAAALLLPLALPFPANCQLLCSAPLLALPSRLGPLAAAALPGCAWMAPADALWVIAWPGSSSVRWSRPGAEAEAGSALPGRCCCELPSAKASSRAELLPSSGELFHDVGLLASHSDV